MKGTLLKDGGNWIVEHWVGLKVFEYPLHPTYEKYYLLNDDDNAKEVEFEVVKENVDTGALEAPYIKIEYANLIKYKMEEPLQFLATQAQELDMGYEAKDKGIKLEKISKEQLEKERNPAYKYFDIDEKTPKQKIKKLTEEEWVELNNAKPAKKQPAVEWFYQRILAKDIKQVFEQAKEMERTQIIEACKYGNSMYRNFESIEVTGIEYYNMNFNKNEQG